MNMSNKLLTFLLFSWTLLDSAVEFPSVVVVKSLHCDIIFVVWKGSWPIQESAGACTAEEGRARQFTASELQADLQPADRVVGPGETRVGTPAA